MHWRGFKDRFKTIIIDLLPSEEEILQRADRSRRKNIKKAESEGLVFTEAEDNEWVKWQDIYSSVWTAARIPPIPLKKLRKENYRLFLAKKGESILGGGLFEESEKSIRFEAYASLKDYQDYRVNDFLYWNSMKYAKNNGKTSVDLGGWQENARGNLQGVNDFKQKWGGEIINVEVNSYNPFYILGRKLVRRFTIFWKVNQEAKFFLWKITSSLFRNR